jgi:hypothetical protein
LFNELLIHDQVIRLGRVPWVRAMDSDDEGMNWSPSSFQRPGTWIFGGEREFPVAHNVVLKVILFAKLGKQIRGPPFR